MGVVSDWAGIESGSSPVATQRSSPGAASPGELSPVGADHRSGVAAERRGRVLRRQQHMVIGSIDAGGQALQRNARVVIVGSALVQLPFVVLNVVLAVLTFRRFEDVDGIFEAMPEVFGSVDGTTGVQTVVRYLNVLTSGLSAALVGGFVTTILINERLGVGNRLRPAFGAWVRRLPALLIAWFVGHAWLFLTAWIDVSVTGEGRFSLYFFGLPIVGALSAMVLCVSPVVMAERAGPITALRRSAGLARNGFSGAWTFGAMSFLLGAAVRYGIGAIPLFSGATGLFSFGPYEGAASAVASQVGLLVSVPLVAIATAEWYVQVRIRSEGMDIDLALDQAFADGSRR